MAKKTNKEKAFYNWRAGAFHLNFPNGNYLSTTFAPCSYSDNYNQRFPVGERLFVPMKSDTCEIMFDCPEKLKKKILKKYNEGDGDPVGYLSIKHWAEIVNLLSK